MATFSTLGKKWKIERCWR